MANNTPKQWSPAELSAIFNSYFSAFVDVMKDNKDSKKVLAMGIDVDKKTNEPQIIVYVDKDSKEDVSIPSTLGAGAIKVSVKVQGIQHP